MKQQSNRLRSLRESIGLSQVKFADVIGSTQSSINDMRTDKRHRLWSFCANMRIISMFRWTISSSAVTSRRARCIRQSPWLVRAILSLLNLWRCVLTPTSLMNDKLKKTPLQMLEEVKA